MLTQEQNREYRRFKQLNEFFDADTSVYETYEPFKDEVSEFKANLAALEDVMPGKDSVSTGISLNKAELKHTAADALGIICRKSYAYALKFNNPEFAAEMNTRNDIIFRKKDGDILPYSKYIRDTVTPFLADANYTKYGVTAEDLLKAVELATRFNALIGKAGEDASGNTVANKDINDAIDMLRDNVRQFDLLVENFETSEPNFVQGYHINSEVDNSGIRHSGIEGYVHNANGIALEGAIIKLLNTTKQTVSDLKGYYHIERATPDDYRVECSYNGLKTASKVLHISRGKTSEVDWVLEA